MKTQLATIALIFSSAVAFSQTMQLQLPSFTKIEINSIANIILKEDSTQSVSVDGTIISSDVAQVKNGVLHIDNAGNNTFHVSIPKLEEIEINGHGDITSESMIHTDQLKLEINGIGKIALDVTANNIIAE